MMEQALMQAFIDLSDIAHISEGEAEVRPRSTHRRMIHSPPDDPRIGGWSTHH